MLPCGCLVERTPGFDDKPQNHASAELALWLRFDEDSFENGLVDDGPDEHPVACDAGACPDRIEDRNGGGAAAFAGKDQCIRIPHAPAFADLDALTVSAWVRLEEASADVNRMAIAKAFGPEIDNTFELYFFEHTGGDDVVEARFGVGGGANAATTRPPFSSAVGVWFHVAGTWDGEFARLWLGGQPGAELPLAAMAIDDHPVLVGCDDDLGGPAFDNVFAGALDDVRIYRGALTAVEIAQLANGEL
jgi:hypothetical protein